MSILYVHNPDTGEAEEVGKDASLPVEISQDLLPPIAGRTITRRVKVPGIGTGSAYQAKDAFGSMITFWDVFRPEQKSGKIVSAYFQDLDDEGLQKDLVLFNRPFTATADNAAFTITDTDVTACIGAVVIDTFVDLNDAQIGFEGNINYSVNSEDCNLYAQIITRGADNIAAGADPYIAIVVEPD